MYIIILLILIIILLFLYIISSNTITNNTTTNNTTTSNTTTSNTTTSNIILENMINITKPLSYQVIQRNNNNTGNINITGNLDSTIIINNNIIEAALFYDNNIIKNWTNINATFNNNNFTGTLIAPAGGFYTLKLRYNNTYFGILNNIGIGEVFVTAGQSNSASYADIKQIPITNRVSTFDGTNWLIANDPQPNPMTGSHGTLGSFMPPLGDALVNHFNVPVGFVACGIGSTSVSSWTPSSLSIMNPPYVGTTSALRTSNGMRFNQFISRMKSINQTFRAILWLQGETDVQNYMPYNLYYTYLKEIILKSRIELQVDIPWFVSLVSFHSPSYPFSTDIRNAQLQLSKDNISLLGPDIDTIQGNTDRHSGGPHFTGVGIKKVANLWFDILKPYIQSQIINL
jgi:hypothetical protein